MNTPAITSFEIQRATKIAQQNTAYQQQQHVELLICRSFIDALKPKRLKRNRHKAELKRWKKWSLLPQPMLIRRLNLNFAHRLLPWPVINDGKSQCRLCGKNGVGIGQTEFGSGSRIGLLGRNGAGNPR